VWRPTANAATSYAGGPAWLDGTTNPATNVEAQLDKIITDLVKQDSGTNSGADKIGAEADGKTLTRGSVASQLRQLSADKIYGFVYPGFRMRSVVDEEITIYPYDCVINGVHRSVTTDTVLSGVTTGLTKGSWYYIYAYWTGAAVDYEYSLTAPTANLKTKTGDPSRTYLGCFRPTPTNGRLKYFTKFDRWHRYSTRFGDFEIRSSITITDGVVTTGTLTPYSCTRLVPPHVISAEFFGQLSGTGPGSVWIEARPTVGVIYSRDNVTLGTGVVEGVGTGVHFGLAPLTPAQEINVFNNLGLSYDMGLTAFYD
jgi:hypothetical protein